MFKGFSFFVYFLFLFVRIDIHRVMQDSCDNGSSVDWYDYSNSSHHKDDDNDFGFYRAENEDADADVGGGYVKFSYQPKLQPYEPKYIWARDCSGRYVLIPEGFVGGEYSRIEHKFLT